MKYYNGGGKGEFSVVGVEPGHESNGYTFLPTRMHGYSWIRTDDLYDTKTEARGANPARFRGYLERAEQAMRSALTRDAPVDNVEAFLWDQLDELLIEDKDDIVHLMGKFGIELKKGA